MDIDENDFFRRATMRILSSLDIETAMWRTLQFLKDFIPADEMYVHLYESGLGAMRTIAKATSSGGSKMDRITRVSAGSESRDERVLQYPYNQ